MLTWSFSSGERAGYVQKLSKKGWLCKTWEGEMALVSMPGTVAEKFPFTVRSDAIARQINDSIGAKVAADATSSTSACPTTCFGETGYFVTAVKVVRRPRGHPLARSLSVSFAASGSPACRATCRSRST